MRVHHQGTLSLPGWPRQMTTPFLITAAAGTPLTLKGLERVHSPSWTISVANGKLRFFISDELPHLVVSGSAGDLGAADHLQASVAQLWLQNLAKSVCPAARRCVLVQAR